MRAEERHYYSTARMRVVKSWVASTSIGVLHILCQVLTIFASNIIFMHVLKSGIKKGPINQDAGNMVNFCQGYCWWPLYLNMDGVE